MQTALNICIDAHDISLTGGIERFVANLANELSLRGHNLFLFTYSNPNTQSRFNYNPDITLIHYFFSGDQHHIPRLRQQILDCNPDVFISPASYNNHILWCAALATTGIPLIYSERFDPDVVSKEFWNKEEREAILLASDKIHLLLGNYAYSIPLEDKDKVVIIPNLAKQFVPTQRENRRGHKIIALGRLHKDKQFHLLIEAFSYIASKFPEWSLEIWGEGEEYFSLQAQINSLNLVNAKLCGLTKKPEEKLQNGDIFCLPSRAEGLPNVVLEAWSCGLPVVGFRENNAMNALVTPGETGLLALEMTPQSLAECLEKLMQDTELREKLGNSGQIEAIKFSPSRIYDAWEKLISDTSTLKGATALQNALCTNIFESTNEKTRSLLLKNILARPNVLLQNNQWIRRIIRRNKTVSSICKILKHNFSIVHNKIKYIKNLYKYKIYNQIKYES